MNRPPHVFILTACHDRRSLTEAFARVIAGQDHTATTLVLVDDGSRDGTAEGVRAILGGRVRIVTGDGRWWWGGAMQRGLVAIARLRPRDEDVVLFCNDDVVFDPDFVSAGLRTMAEHPGTLLLAQGDDEASGAVVESGQHLRLWRLAVRPARHPGELDCAPTRGLFVRWAEVRRIGGFIPHRLPHYYSDYEWTRRAVRLGIRIVCLPHPRLRVHVGATGLHGLQDRGCRFRRRLWSIRHAGNPVYQIRFAARVCPWPLASLHLVRIWMQTMLRLVIRA